MTSPVSYVTCPACRERFYIHRPDFEAHPEAYCYCPFCEREFDVEEGRAQPPVVRGSPGRQAGARHA
jgi:hypothetical protein